MTLWSRRQPAAATRAFKQLAGLVLCALVCPAAVAFDYIPRNTCVLNIRDVVSNSSLGADSQVDLQCTGASPVPVSGSTTLQPLQTTWTGPYAFAKCRFLCVQVFASPYSHSRDFPS